MSDNTVTAALRRKGYSGDDMAGQGFRSMASTLLNEQGWNRDAIDRQLAHGERDAVRAAYNYAQHLSERREIDDPSCACHAVTEQAAGPLCPSHRSRVTTIELDVGLYFYHSGNMKSIEVVAALGALAQDSRLAVF